MKQVPKREAEKDWGGKPKFRCAESPGPEGNETSEQRYFT